MFRIGKSFSFEAAHHVDGLPDGHKCARRHGHSYLVEVILASDELSGPGFVADFDVLTPVKSYLDSDWDHRDLNEVMPDAQPTSENIARALYDWCLATLDPRVAALVAAVRVSESRSTWAEYHREPAPPGRPS